MRTRRSAARSVVAVVACLLVSGCSNVPYMRGRWFEPSPTPEPPTPALRSPDLDLTGTLTTDHGLTATVTTDLWWGDTTQSSPPTRRRPAGWTQVHVQLHGTTTVTNTSSRPNPAATSVFYELNAAYPLGSRVCQLLVPPHDGSMLTDGYCWQLIATSTPFSYYQGPPVPLQPGQSQPVEIGATGHPAGVSVDVPDAEAAAVAGDLRHPSFIAVTTNDIAGLGPTFRFRHNCPGGITGPTSKDREQHVNLSSTSPLSCHDLPQVGSGY